MDAKTLAEKIGQSIKSIRKVKDLSRNQLSEKSGVSAITIQRVEGGQAVGLGLDNLLAIATGLGVSVADLLYEAERGPAEMRKINSRWDYLVDRVDKFTLNQKEWVARILLEVIERPLM